MQNNYRLQFFTLTILFSFMLFTSCATLQTTPNNNCTNHTVENTAEDLASCLPLDASIEQVETQLRQWQRIDDGEYWENVTFADILPNGNDELIITYHENLQDMIWNPQGMLAVLQRQGTHWKVVFESPQPTETVNTPESLQGNWAFHILATGDVSNDGYDDLILKQYYSNGTHSNFGHIKLITQHKDNPNQLDFLYIHPLASYVPQYVINNGKILADYHAIRRWYDYKPSSQEFVIAQEEINPEQAALSVETSDGAKWFAFYEHVSWLRESTFALYQVQDEQVTRFEVPFIVSFLDQLDDEMIYIGGAGQLMRFENGALVDVLANFAPLMDTSGKPMTAQLAADGSLWVAAGYRLWHLAPKDSHNYEILARNVTVASDGSVWAMAWDGVAENLDKCCFVKIAGSDVERYWFDTELPVSSAVESQIRAMRTEN